MTYSRDDAVIIYASNAVAYTCIYTYMASMECRQPLLGETQVEQNVELLTYGRPPIRQTANRVVTVRQLLEQAVRNKYGRRIRLLSTPATDAELERFWNNLRISIRPVDTEPKEVGRSIVDITTKDYINNGSEKDESTIEISKPTGIAKGSSAEWYVKNGLSWSVNSNVGSNIMRLAAMVPVSGTVGAVGLITKQRLEEDSIGHTLGADSLMLQYKKQEKVVVPPHSKVTVSVTSYAIRYSFNYTLQLSALATDAISIQFRTPCQNIWAGCCTGCCKSTGYITARELLTAMQLPGYSEGSGWVHFTQDGVLSWVGDAVKVQKKEQPLS